LSDVEGRDSLSVKEKLPVPIAIFQVQKIVLFICFTIGILPSFSKIELLFNTQISVKNSPEPLII